MTARRLLPNRRAQELVEVIHRDQRYQIAIGYYPDGSIGETWVDGPKPGSDMDFLASDAATIVSVALQHGVPPQAFSKSMARDSSGNPATIIGALADELAKRGETR